MDSLDDTKPCPDRMLGIVLMGSRVPEISQDTIAHVLGNKAVEPDDYLGDGALIGSDDLAQILGVETGGEFCGADEIAEHDRQLSPFCGPRSRRSFHRRNGLAL